MPLRVMIVEDEAIVALDLHGQIEGFGHVVSGVYADAEAALAAVAAPDVAVLDVRLQGTTDGVTLAEELYVCNDVPVVLVSARTDRETLVRATRAGAYGFVAKPFSAGALGAAIELAVAKHAEVRRLREAARLTRLLVDGIDMPVIVTDGCRRIASLNAAAGRLLAVRPVAAIDRDLGELVTGLDAWAPIGALAAMEEGTAQRGTGGHGGGGLAVSVSRGHADHGEACWVWTLIATERTG